MLALALSLACGGEASLDEREPAATTEPSTSGGTLPVLDGSDPSTGEASTGEPAMSDDPRLCAADCPLVLPLDWVYEGVASTRPSEPGAHVLTTMLREPDGTLTLGEQRDGTTTLHRIDRHGALQWNVPLPLPCDRCELTHVASSPSGDLLLSASGWLLDGELSLLAARYDPERHAVVWTSHRPLQPAPGVSVRSGDITALGDDRAAQIYMTGDFGFEAQQVTRLTAYDAQGLIIADEPVTLGPSTQARPPLRLRSTPDDELVIASFSGYDWDLRGQLDRVAPPLWQSSGHVALTVVVDDLRVDAGGHALALGHTFDGTRTHLVLSDRSRVDPTPRWLATLAFVSTSASPAALALGPDGDLYAAVRTTEAPSEDATPLVSLALARFSSDGELRGSATLLLGVAETVHPVALAIDDDEGLVIGAVVDDRLRVERRTQHCACG